MCAGWFPEPVAAVLEAEFKSSIREAFEWLRYGVKLRLRVRRDAVCCAAEADVEVDGGKERE